MAKTSSKTIDKLRGIYRLAVVDDKNGQYQGTKIRPGKVEQDKNGNKTIKPLELPSSIEKAMDYFLSNFAGPYNPTRNHLETLRDIDFMIKNEGLMSTAARIYTQEAYDTENNSVGVEINAIDKKIETHFYDWLRSIKFNSNVLKDIAWNLVCYADAFWINAYDEEKGIVGFTVLDPYLVKDIMEFSIGTVNRVQQWSSSYLNITNKSAAMDDVMKLMSDDAVLEDFSLFYQTYNMGYLLKYSVDDKDDNLKGVPPWAITHFRINTNSSEFFPFGMPLFIHSIAVYRSFKTTQMLIDMLRVASFPRTVVKIKGGDTLTPLDMVDRVNDAREMIENLTPVTNNKDNIAVGETLYQVDGYFEYDIMDTTVDLDKLGDLDLKRKDLILSTSIPDTILNPSEGNGGVGGESAQALYFNNKTFQRRVGDVKGAILEGLSFAYRLHLEITNAFDGEETEFELSLPVNASMYNDNKMEQDTAALSFATELLSNLGQALGMERGQVFPRKVVQDVMKHFVDIDPRLIDRWIKQIADSAEEQSEEDQGGSDGDGKQDSGMPLIVQSNAVGGGSKSPVRKKENYGEKAKRFLESWERGDEYSENLLREIYFKTKKEIGKTEGFFGKKITYNNSYDVKADSEKKGYKYSPFGLLREHMLNQRARRLQEKTEGKPESREPITWKVQDKTVVKEEEKPTRTY